MLRDQILQAKDLKEKDVFIDCWNVEVRVRELSAQDLNDVQKHMSKMDKTEKDSYLSLAAVYAAYAIVNPNTGQREFLDSDIPALKNKSSKALLKILATVNELGSIEDSVEETAKN